MNNHKKKISLRSRYQSFVFAFKGLRLFFLTQPNAWIHVAATVIVIGAGLFFKVTFVDWCFLVFAIGFVFTAELFNTSIEFLTDLVSPDYHEKAGKVKDLAAAGVLIAAIIAVVIGCIVFIPKIIS